MSAADAIGAGVLIGTVLLALDARNNNSKMVELLGTLVSGTVWGIVGLFVGIVLPLAFILWLIKTLWTIV